ncbi:GPI inositol-deacylase [Odontomachus brunneus]|uniref:GPI inositol-deacylase n=1 Tax=Odontomachus brunneus TaxID=486640 RepID=UPI0013F18527|nr:GPI inositol-deacylase [Odontomachus brunneus]
MISVKSIIIYSISILFFIYVCLLYILGVARYMTDFEENTCEMTYMFEYPQYVRISLENDIEEKYPRFALYAYGEGSVTEKLRRMHFSGIPVLFIPGNAGSHQQVRSIASVSLRKSLKNRTPYHFDFFTVSFSKDYSALYGGVLMEQTIYVSHCIKAILALYKGKMDSVVLIGHSMGGIIAKGALLLAPDMNASFANMIINLATPHTPVLVLDSGFASYYYELENRSGMIKDAGTKVVSIGGGPRDVLVTAAQTFDRTADINVLSTSVPAVWKSTDHLSILWCKQLVLAIVRSLFDTVDTKKRSRITSNPDLKMQALSYHFLQRSSGKKLYHYEEKVQFETNGEWITIVPEQYVWNNKNKKISSTIYLTMKLSHESDFLTIDATNLENKDWLFVCIAPEKQEQRKICEWGWNLTNKTRILPDPLDRTRRTVDLDLKKIDYPNVTHVVVRITPHDLEKYLTVSFDSYFYESRVESANDKFMHLTYFLGFREYDFVKTAKGSIRYYVTLLNIMDAVVIEVKSLSCIDKKQHAIVELIEPWNMGAIQSRFFTNTDDGPKTMKIQTPYEHPNQTARLRLTLDPECLYEIYVQPGGIIDKISCRVRDRWPLLYIVIISLLLLFLSARIHLDSDIMTVIIVTIMLSFYLNIIYETYVALCIIGLSAIGVCFAIIFLGSVIEHGIVARLLSRVIAYTDTWSNYFVRTLVEVPFLMTIIILPLNFAICGALTMIISLLLYFMKLTRMYENYLEQLLMASLQHFKWFKRFKRSRNEESNNRSTSENVYNHLVLFLLFSFTAIPAIPSVLVWAKNFSYDKRLTTEDHILFLSWTVLATCVTFDITKCISRCKGMRSLILSNMVRLLGWIILSLTAAPPPLFYHYCMPPIVALVMILTVSISFLKSD